MSEEQVAEKISKKIEEQGMGSVYARAARAAPSEDATRIVREHGRNQIIGIEHDLVFERDVLGQTIRVHKHRWPVSSSVRAMVRITIAKTSYDPGTNILMNLEVLTEYRDELTKIIKTASASVKKAKKKTVVDTDEAA